MTEEVGRCVRCRVRLKGPPHLMAGRVFCCASCAVGSACEHQGIHRSASVRRFDSMFRPFRETVRHSTPFEYERPGEGS